MCLHDKQDSTFSSATTTMPHEKDAVKCLMKESELLEGNARGSRNVWFPSVIGLGLSVVISLFSLWFPFALVPDAANKTYLLAQYMYDPSVSYFDNTAWTYMTDYGLGFVMSVLAVLVWMGDFSKASVHIRRCSVGLLLCYVASVIAGAVSHQWYTELEQRNTWHFRCLWTVCVGTVAVASTFMGCVGSELARVFQKQSTRWMPVVPDSFWVAFGVGTTVLCAAGYFSYQRPACDIFIAGITQFPSSFYNVYMLVLALRDSTYVLRKWQLVGGLCFVSNAPLLPLYPLLVQYTDWSLASVNTFLHSWLLISWTAQALTMRHLGHAVGQSQRQPPKAIPIQKKNY